MTKVLKDRESYVDTKDFDKDRFHRFVDDIIDNADINPNIFTPTHREEFKIVLVEKIEQRKDVSLGELYDLIIREADDNTSIHAPHYSKIAASAFLRKLYKIASNERGQFKKDIYTQYPSLVKLLTEKGIYSEELLQNYTVDELATAGAFIDPSKDRLFSYAGLFLLNRSYLAQTGPQLTIELPQERLLTCALYLMMLEPKDKRLDLVKETYWALSNHYVGLATPTLSNAGKSMGTLSSCHILTMDDSLKSIMNVLTDAATFSQNGAGLGVFMGYLRSNGSWIRGKKGAASGIIGPSSLQNALADYVNQLGVRKGGIAVYLPIWHRDVFDFLDLRLKTGSQERRAHSLYTGLTIPDEFMRRLRRSMDATFTLFDPYEVNKKLGIDLNRLYDKKRLQEDEEPNPEDHAFTYHYRLAEASTQLLLRKEVSMRDLYKPIFNARKSGGTPYLYFHDTAARLNPNDHAGMPMSSNLCTEIVQNMEYDVFEKDTLHENGLVFQMKKNTGLVTCNLSSLCLHNVFTQNVDLQRVADIQIRMLDNVISLDRTVVPQATHTNRQYRAIGAGALGLATLLAEKRIMWDSEEAVTFSDELFEKIAFANITASMKLAKEKGAYPLFKGSKWQTGELFSERGYSSDEWSALQAEIANYGIRNAYLMANAPTGSNSIIMNGSASTDAPFEVVYEEKKDGLQATIIPRKYDVTVQRFYKSAFTMDERWSLRIIAALQRHIDQGISHNLHLHSNIAASELLPIDIGAWEKGLKTLYYSYTDPLMENRKADCVSCEG